jgi:hypothetical protein
MDMPIARASASTTALPALLVLMSLVVPACTVFADPSDDLALTAEHHVDGNVRLWWTWLDDDRVDHYNVYWEKKRFDSVSDREVRSEEHGTTYLVTDLEDGVPYHFAVAAVDSNGTVLAEDHQEAVPNVPVLKEVNYANLMVALLIATVVFVFVLIKIPTWTKRQKGGA